MRFQKIPGNCGPCAISNALRVFGVKKAERVVAAAAGTSEEGTGEEGMVAAINTFGFVATEYKSKNRSDGITWLNYALALGPVILCVDNYGHWITVIGRSLDRYVFIDSSNTKKNKQENGIQVFSKKEIVRRWYNKSVNELYGIAVSKRA